MFLLAPSLEVNQLSLPAQNNPFGTAGSFGDAFGPIGSLMATIAASGALYAFVNDRHDRKVQQFESNFFALLANFESITAQAKLTFGKNKGDVSFKSKYRALEKAVNHSPKRVFQGRSALRVLVLRIREGVNPSGFNDIKVVSNVYQGLFNNNVNMLGHYFRTLHHLFRLIDERCLADKDFYARILRAQLSDEELCLIAYNCIVGEGRFKFKHLAVRFSLFHNLHRLSEDPHKKAELSFFQRKLPREAFRFEEQGAISYND